MAKTASLVFFYFGEDSYVRALAQETVPLWRALKGYDKAVLLHHEIKAGPFELSQRAQRQADVLDLPTKENLAKYLNALGDEGYEVDLYIFSHGLPNKFVVSLGEYGDSEMVTRRWLEANVRPLNLRMVWQCNCYGSTLNDCWRGLGAKVTGGAQFVNFYPTRFKGFIKRWQDGETFAGACSRSDTKWSHTPVQAFMVADAATRADAWEGDVGLAFKVLGNNEHSQRYFRECWLEEDEIPGGKSGKQVMNNSSKMLIEGDRSLTKDKALTW